MTRTLRSMALLLVMALALAGPLAPYAAAIVKAMKLATSRNGPLSR